MIQFNDVTAYSSPSLFESGIKEPMNLTLPETGILYVVQKQNSGSEAFLKLVSGKVVPETGTIKDGEFSSPASWEGKAVSVLKKNSCPLPYLSLRENLLIGSKGEEKRKEVLSLTGLSSKEESIITSLTDAEKEKAGLALILMTDIHTILVSLPSLSEEMMGILREVSKTRLILIFVDSIPEGEQNYLEFDDGKIVHAPEIKEVGHKPSLKPEAKKIGFGTKLKYAFTSFKKNTVKTISALVLFALSLAGFASVGNVAFYDPYQAMPDANYVNISGMNLTSEKMTELKNETGADFKKVITGDPVFLDIWINSGSRSFSCDYLDGSSLNDFPSGFNVKEGRLPSSDTDLMLSDAFVFLMKNSAVHGYLDSGYQTITLGSDESVIGKTYGRYTVSGVLNTGFDESKYAPLFSSYTQQLEDEFFKAFFDSYRDILMVSKAESERIAQTSSDTRNYRYLAKIDDKATLIRVVKYCEKDFVIRCSSNANPYIPGGTFYAILAVSLVLLVVSLILFVPLLVEDSVGFLNLRDKLNNIGATGSGSFAATKIVVYGLILLVLSCLVSLPLTLLLNYDFLSFYHAALPAAFAYIYPVYMILVFLVLFLALVYLFFYREKRKQK